MGGKEVDKAISELIKECVAASGANIEVSTANPYLAPATQGGMPVTPSAVNGFMGMGMFMSMNQAKQTLAPDTSEPAPSGPWDCPCGKTGNTGKFCPECGNPRC